MDAGPSSAVAAQRIRGVFLSASLVCSPFSLVRPEHRWKTYNSWSRQYVCNENDTDRKVREERKLDYIC